MIKKTTISIFAAIILCSTSVWAQEQQDPILQGINTALSQGNCEKAQKLYTAYKAGGKTSASIEKRIKECKESKKATPPPEKKPVTPQSTKTTNTPTVDGGSVAMINAINQHLTEKECDKAQTVYNTWKTYTKKTYADIEKRIKICNDSKKVTTTDTEKKPVTPTVTTTTNTPTVDGGSVAMINAINQHLTEKECDKAQTVYDTWKTYTKKTDADIEKRIKTCNDSKKVTTTDTEKKPVTPTVATTTNTSTTDAGVVINGIRWATRNVNTPGTFAANPEDAGMFYQWNRKIAWAATGDVTGWDDTDPTGTTWEKANDPCPAGWRVPTYAELQSLKNSGSSWTTSPANGRIFGSGTNTIFLPAAGRRNNSAGTLYNVGYRDSYWSSTQYNETCAYGLGFSSGGVYSHGYGRRSGFSVRCVAE